MFSAVLGISMLAHILIIVIVKVKNFLTFVFYGRAKKKRGRKNNRAFTALAIAAVTELVAILVIISSFMIVSVSVANDNSNYKIIKRALSEFQDKSLSADCIFQKKCGYNPPDASIPIS
ncbi:MAG: hypothetical protein ABIJ84_03005 [bacterium]